MRDRKFIRIVSYLLVAGGAWLLFSGARELLTPWIHQQEIPQSWKPSPKPGPPQAPRNPPLHLGETLARLSIPRLHASWYVVEGTDRKDLRLGPGHLPGTALPGESGNCVIAGHRDTQFRALKDIRKGDEIVLDTRAGPYRYRVTGLGVISPKNTRPLDDTPTGVLSLITCYPFYYLGPAPRRFVVRADLLPPREARVR